MYSPLRYPGGKAVLANFFKDLISINNLEGCTYCEAYAGGAGAALDLLISKNVKNIWLNDIDIHLYHFWNSILKYTEDFIAKINETDINIETWKIQQNIYLHPNQYSTLEVGFSTFYLNRCNRSGILAKAGPIGGMQQNGNYGINARFNKIDLIERIKLISHYSKQIHISNLDAINFVEKVNNELDIVNVLLYLDPPYYKKGKTLYLNFYQHRDHKKIAEKLNQYPDLKWIVSYDNVCEIQEIYCQYKNVEFDLNYSLQKRKKGKEIMIFSPEIQVPDFLYIGKRIYEMEY